MNKRLMIIVTVFVAGFGAGYGLTWLLVSGPGPAQGPERLAEASPEPAGGDAVAAVAPTEVPEPGLPGAAEAGEVDDGDEPVAADGPRPDPPVAADPAPREAAQGGGEAVAPADPELPPAPPAPWWERCKGKVCTIDFGRVTGGLSVREGTITHGEEVVWRDRFANAERVGTLPVRRGLEVELHAVGMLHQLPVAAQITWRGAPGKPLRGVIALNIGDKVISLVDR